MNFNFKCAVCGVEIQAHVSDVANFVDVQITVEPHECKPTEKNSTLSDAVMEIGDSMVEVGYFKKDGRFVTMRGYFNGKYCPMNKIGYEFFLKAVGDGFAPRNLIRRGITSIFVEETEFTYIIS